jgi:hypothetical protein
MMLAIAWTLVVFAFGWVNLPRAHQVPHDPQFLSRLSNEAASILSGNYAKPKPVRGALVWPEDPRIMRMSNGTRLTFPATTTNERAARVASEYDQMLSVEADRQRGAYLREMLAIWLAPLLLAGFAASVRGREYLASLGVAMAGARLLSPVSNVVASSSATSAPVDRSADDIVGSGAARSVFAARRRFPYARGELCRTMFTNEHIEHRARAATTALMGRP